MSELVSYKNIVEVNKDGIVFLDNKNQKSLVDFCECRRNWVEFVNKSDEMKAFNVKEEDTNCVGWRDAFQNPSYIEFFSEPRIKVIFDIQPNFIENILKKTSSKEYKEFYKFQKRITNVGWTTFDLG